MMRAYCFVDSAQEKRCLGVWCFALVSFTGMHNRRDALEGMLNTVFLRDRSVHELPEERMRGKRAIRKGSCTRKLVGFGRHLLGYPSNRHHMLEWAVVAYWFWLL